jgi:hypothetical protein
MGDEIYEMRNYLREITGLAARHLHHVFRARHSAPALGSGCCVCQPARGEEKTTAGAGAVLVVMI